MCASPSPTDPAAPGPRRLSAPFYPAEGSSGVWPATLVGVLSTTVAAFGSWRQSLWTDESATINAAGRSVPELWRMTRHIDLVHGTYYLFMHVWTGLFGFSPFVLRLPSAVAVGLATSCVFLLARRLRDARFALLAASLFAALPRVFWSGTEARSYAATTLLAAGAALLLTIALDTGSRNAWTGYAVVVLAGVAVNLFVGLIILAHLVTIFWDRGLATAHRRAWFISAGLAALASAPLVLTATEQSGQVGEHSFGPIELVRNVAVNQWFLGDTPTSTTGVGGRFSLIEPGSWWIPGSLVLAVLAWPLILYAVWARNPSGGGVGSANRSVLPYVLPVIVVPTAVIGVYSLLTTPLYSPRYLTFTSPAVAITIALGVASVSRRTIRVAVVGVMILATVPVYVSQREIYGKNSSDWSSVAAYVRSHASAGDGVYFTPRYTLPGPTVGQTARGILIAYPGDFAGLSDVTLQQTPSEAGNLTGVSRRLADSTSQLAGSQAVWVIERVDYPVAQATADAAVLINAGLYATPRGWTGPLDRVLEYRRID